MTKSGIKVKKLKGNLKRIRRFERYYNYTYPKNSHDDVELICRQCSKRFLVPYKRRNMKFCSLSCSTTHKNLNTDYSKRKIEGKK